MAKILVADRLPTTRRSLGSILSEGGHDFVEAKNGRETFEKASQERPDLILADLGLLETDSLQVLGKLRENPATRAIPIIILGESYKGESTALRLGAANYILKPPQPATLTAAVRIALRDAAETASKPNVRDQEEAPVAQAGGGDPTVIKSGVTQLDQAMRGGIPVGTLTLVEGIQAAGKSVLCQHLAYGSLLDNHGVAYFTSETDADGLSSQMDSIGLGVSRYTRGDKFRVYPMERPSRDDDPGHLMDLLAENIGQVPSKYDVAIVDSVTNLAYHIQSNALVGFFSQCQRFPEDGRTIMIAARSYVFDGPTLARLHSLCDSHFSLGEEAFGQKTMKMLEVSKVRGVEPRSGNTVFFEVMPETGIRISSGGKVRI
jgi:flagellar protein FlaH